MCKGATAKNACGGATSTLLTPRLSITSLMTGAFLSHELNVRGKVGPKKVQESSETYVQNTKDIYAPYPLL